MMTSEEFVLELNNNEEQQSFKLAIVVALFENDTAKIKFDGEEEPSEKQYAYLNSYTPKISDRVLLGVLGGTYVILGKVSFNEEPSQGLGVIESEIVSIKLDIVANSDEIASVKDRVATAEDGISSLDTRLATYIRSNMNEDVNGNMNIGTIYVDPSTGQLRVKRKNGTWTYYNKV